MFIKKRSNLSTLKATLLNKKISNCYKIGLIRVGRKKSYSFKIVVMDWNRKYFDVLGTYNPKMSFSRFLYNGQFSLKLGKTLIIDFKKLYFWIHKKIFFKGFLHKIIRVFNIAYNLIEKDFIKGLIIINNQGSLANQTNFFSDQIVSIEKILIKRPL